MEEESGDDHGDGRDPLSADELVAVASALAHQYESLQNIEL